MKLYKNENNNIFAYEEDGSQDHLINGKTPITQIEADEIIAKNNAPLIAAEKAKQQAKEAALDKLTKLGLTEDEVKALVG
jgi:hypothetical protein